MAVSGNHHVVKEGECSVLLHVLSFYLFIHGAMLSNTRPFFHMVLGANKEGKVTSVAKFKKVSAAFLKAVILLFYSCPPPSNNHPPSMQHRVPTKRRGWPGRGKSKKIRHGLPHAVATAGSHRHGCETSWREIGSRNKIIS